MDADRLRRLPLFAGLTSRELDEVCRFAEDYEEPTGSTLIREGDYGYELVVLEEGTAEIVRGGETVDSIVAGEFFGEVAVLRRGRLRNASVVATSPVRIIAVTGQNVRTLRDRIPALARELDRAAAEHGG